MYSNCTIGSINANDNYTLCLSADGIAAISKVSNSASVVGDSLSTLAYATSKVDVSASSATANCSSGNSTKEYMPQNAKTLLYNRRNTKGIYIKIADKDGCVGADKYLMSDIVDVSIIESNEHCRVIVATFSDGGKEKAVLSNDDFFTLEQGISICIAKKLLSDRVGETHGSSVYNKLISRGVKVFENRIKEANKKAAEEAAMKEKYKKIVAKKQAKRKKRIAEERENQIEIQKEAYLRAMHEYNTRSAD